MTKTIEWCSCCGVEVELDDIMKAQKCPSCNERILPCSFCNDTIVKPDCANCPLGG
ncbi:hypothetical protein CPT_Mater232 [Bacillus phage Mater]|uniref:Uncharacterized protein n=1 Tax=Bacillus phage Mater TaxID=1540090 RepID=A0A0A0RP28_9CAUD|nr:hypothetical protein CPT_Mater10 [Bacillus phage Mater]YP_009151191.1 hypothetical protein CPT_Mater232 [Bacillus phage Mater]AIW03167.1 hypothetical protein CPT_Mater10 [Bacillus phage Mater]AIW03389.1 hypothetical protein CPT_Mater232 [Bacillus phage Mater]